MSDDPEADIHEFPRTRPRVKKLRLLLVLMGLGLLALISTAFGMMMALAADLDELEAARIRFLGRKSDLKLALREVRDRETGMTLNAVRQAVEAAAQEREDELRRAELERALAEDVLDVTLPGEELHLGTLHPTTLTRRVIEDAFIGLGYEVLDDREVETVEYNFDKLAFPPAHPTRSPRDTFFLDDNRLLRTETSPAQIHLMEQKGPPIYMVSLGRVYRRDEITPTRFPIFHQFEGLAVDKNLTLADLKGTLLHVMRALFGEQRQVRFRTHFFPFTEPSIEPDVSCPICDMKGCRTCKFTGWIEMGGAGMVDPQVFLNVDLDPEEWTGFAFGCGIDRLAMLKYGMDDLRAFFDGDLRWLQHYGFSALDVPTLSGGTGA